MKNFIPTISAAIAAAAAMYFLDPEQGRRRRALVREKVVSVSLQTGDATRAQGHRVRNRFQGWAARLAAFPARARSDDPRTLHQRVRARLGRVVSHPKAVHAEVMDDRTVCLNGHILENELVTLLDEIERVPGVSRVDSRLTVHESAGNIPQLHGHSRRSAARGDGRLWRVLALTAPVAILAASVRPARPHRNDLAADLRLRAGPLSGFFGRIRKPWRRFSGLLARS